LHGDDESFAGPGEISGLGVIDDMPELQDMRITDVALNPFVRKAGRGSSGDVTAALGASL
jgi:hypothetical protein